MNLKGRRERLSSSFINQVEDFMILIPIVAAIISAALGEIIDASIILAIVIINARSARYRRAGGESD